MASDNKKYGISVKLPENDPMSAAHLLGDDWAGERWYSTADERDTAIVQMQNHPRYYRKGDTPTITLEKIERT